MPGHKTTASSPPFHKPIPHDIKKRTHSQISRLYILLFPAIRTQLRRNRLLLSRKKTEHSQLAFLLMGQDKLRPVWCLVRRALNLPWSENRGGFHPPNPWKKISSQCFSILALIPLFISHFRSFRYPPIYFPTVIRIIILTWSPRFSVVPRNTLPPSLVKTFAQKSFFNLKNLDCQFYRNHLNVQFLFCKSIPARGDELIIHQNTYLFFFF